MDPITPPPPRQLVELLTLQEVADLQIMDFTLLWAELRAYLPI